jgi:hypothetical protein
MVRFLAEKQKLVEVQRPITLPTAVVPALRLDVKALPTSTYTPAGF